jgi:signal transduction histidine kinase
MNLFSGRVKEISIISIILIIIISYGLFFYLQNITEHSIRNSLFEQQQERQVQATQAISQHIGSDLRLVMSILQGLADSAYLQQGTLSGDKTNKLMQEKYSQANTLTTVDGLFIADKDDIITSNIVSKGQKSFINIDISFRDYVKETRRTLTPTFSNGFEGIDGKYRIAMTYPIINRDTGYVGLVGAEIPTIPFFEYYGNTYDIKSQYLAVMDRNSVQLIHPVKSFIGTPFFGSYTQDVTEHNTMLNNIIQTVLSGKQDFGIYEFKNGERLNTGTPIFVAGKPIYFIFIITPTSAIYSQINDVISVQRLQTFSLLAGITTAVVILIVFLIKWNSSLDREVKRRTKELDESNKQFVQTNKKLESANEQLKVHDKMQNEFINIAAHELRTPIQPILSLTEVLRFKIKDTQQVDLLSIITRNAKRLQRLTEDILDVTKIESHSLKLNKERFNLSDLISSIIDDYRNRIERDNIAVKLLYEPNNKDNIFVEADRGRLIQVISNLLDNAIKFTKEGTISIITEEKDSKVIVSVKDTGTGIDPEILPRLFSKFASKSERGGTGLGLFICKNIVEAHGGKIWIESNDIYKEKGGATFSFSLPIMKQQPINVEQIDK